MFKWELEKMELMNSSKVKCGDKMAYLIESKLSQEEKIEFVDSMQNGKLSYIIELIKKYKKDRVNLPKNEYGRVKTVSMKAWAKKNDTKFSKPLIDIDYNYGDIYLLGVGKNIEYDNFSSYIDEMFHYQLVKCEAMERDFFREHDEYSVLQELFLKKMRTFNTSFGVRIIWSSNNEVYVGTKDGNDKREITIDELKRLLALYDKLEKYENELCSLHDVSF